MGQVPSTLESVYGRTAQDSNAVSPPPSPFGDSSAAGRSLEGVAQIMERAPEVGMGILNVDALIQLWAHALISDQTIYEEVLGWDQARIKEERDRLKMEQLLPSTRSAPSRRASGRGGARSSPKN